jgi:hypothetical protein
LVGESGVGFNGLWGVREGVGFDGKKRKRKKRCKKSCSER